MLATQETPREAQNMRHRKYRTTEKGKETERRYRASERNKRLAVIRTLRYERQNKEKRRAQRILARVKKAGEITPQPCVICGSTINVHGHHEDYNQPLCVVWMCQKHHREYHALLNQWKN